MSENLLTLKMVTKGLTATEHKFLAATVKLSQRRKPALMIVPEAQFLEADVVLIDGSDEEAMAWAEAHRKSLATKPVIWVDSPAQRVGQGSLSRPVLWVNLPIIIARVLEESSLLEVEPELSNETPSVAETNNQQINPKVESVRLDRKKVLVVDDSPAIRTHLANILRNKQYDVTAAESGESAIEAISSQDFDCTLMDVLMPGMDGYEACKIIKSRKHNSNDIPVIMLTGKSSPFDRIRGKIVGCDAYLTKPVDIEKLRKALEKLVA